MVTLSALGQTTLNVIIITLVFAFLGNRFYSKSKPACVYQLPMIEHDTNFRNNRKRIQNLDPEISHFKCIVVLYICHFETIYTHIEIHSLHIHYIICYTLIYVYTFIRPSCSSNKQVS